MGTFAIDGTAKANGANAVLVAIAQEAAKSSPYNVTVFSGKRYGGGSSMHDKGQAVDIVLTDPASGEEIPNLKSATGFPIYESFAAQMRAAQMKVAPSYSANFRWGGWFGSSKLNPGGVDLMHFDLKSSRLMAGGDWKAGTYGWFRKQVDALGGGYIYSASGQRRADGKKTYASLWGREPILAEDANGVPLPRPRPDYDPNNPNNLRPPADIPSASDKARAFGASRAIADRQAVLDRQPAGKRDSITPLSTEHQRMLTAATERRAEPASVPMPRSRPALIQTQKAIAAGNYLRKGSKGAAVSELQKFLNDQGYTDAKGRALKIDGNLGPRTRAALTAYQQDRGLRPDSIVGIKTLADMAAIQEQADNPMTRGQSPEMGGDRFDVAQIIEGPAPGLPGGGIGSDFATGMGQSLAVNLAGGGGALDALEQPGFGISASNGGYLNIPRDIWSGDSAVLSKTFRAPLGMPDAGIDVMGGRNLGFMGRAPVNFENATDAPQYTPGMLRDQKSAKSFGDFLGGAGSMIPAGAIGDQSYLSADELQFQADLTPSMGGAAGGSLGGGGGAAASVIGAYGRTARDLAAWKAAQAGRAIPVASVDPFSNLRAASIAQLNAFNFSQAQAAALAATLNTGGGAGGVFSGGSGGSQSGFTSPGEGRNSSSGGGSGTVSGTSPSVSGGQNTTSNPGRGGMGGSSTSSGTSSSLGGGGGGGRTGSSSRSNP